MADVRLRRLEQRVFETDDPQDKIRYAAELSRTGKKEEARNLLHPLTKRCPQARPLFVSLLPSETAHAFCSQCGKTFDLDAEGYPISSRGKRAEKRTRCEECALTQPFRGSDHVTANALKPKYCGRCGIVLRNPAHRCDRKLPDWISGGDGRNVGHQREPNRHWSNWRNFA